MITQLEGVVRHTAPGFIILHVGGVGYGISVGSELLSVAEASGTTPLLIWTHQAIREDSNELYGFRDEESLTFFRELIKISGIGPKSAMGIMSVASLKVLKDAIANENTTYLTKVSGIGKKTAEKVVLELRDKLDTTLAGADGSYLASDVDALEALKSLGYSPAEARDALKKIPSETSETNARVKAALRLLSNA